MIARLREDRPVGKGFVLWNVALVVDRALIPLNDWNRMLDVLPTVTGLVELRIVVDVLPIFGVVEVIAEVDAAIRFDVLVKMAPVPVEADVMPLVDVTDMADEERSDILATEVVALTVVTTL
jgi:hypothetical protein